jgi:hypothetical protein
MDPAIPLALEDLPGLANVTFQGHNGIPELVLSPAALTFSRIDVGTFDSVFVNLSSVPSTTSLLWGGIVFKPSSNISYTDWARVDIFGARLIGYASTEMMLWFLNRDGVSETLPEEVTVSSDASGIELTNDQVKITEKGDDLVLEQTLLAQTKTTVSLTNSVKITVSENSKVTGIAFEFAEPGTITIDGTAPADYSFELRVSMPVVATLDSQDRPRLPVSISGAGSVVLRSTQADISLGRVSAEAGVVSLVVATHNSVTLPSVSLRGAGSGLRARRSAAQGRLLSLDPEAVPVVVQSAVEVAPGSTASIFSGVLSGHAIVNSSARLAFHDELVLDPDFVFYIDPFTSAQSDERPTALAFEFYIAQLTPPARIVITNATGGAPIVPFNVARGSNLDCAEWGSRIEDETGLLAFTCEYESDRRFLVAALKSDAQPTPKKKWTDNEWMVYGILGGTWLVVIILVIVVIVVARRKGAKESEASSEHELAAEDVEAQPEPPAPPERPAAVIEDDSSSESVPNAVENEQEDELTFYDLGPDIYPYGAPFSNGSNRDRFFNKS